MTGLLQYNRHYFRIIQCSDEVGDIFIGGKTLDDGDRLESGPIYILQKRVFTLFNTVELFHSGIIDIDDIRLSWIYDVGIDY